jgi:hypothetical protein
MVIVLAGIAGGISAGVRSCAGSGTKTAATRTSGPSPTRSASPSPAAFKVVSLERGGAYVGSGGTVTVTAKIGNTGGVSGTYRASLKVDGRIVTKKGLLVPANSVAAATFKVKLAGDKTHKISLGNRSVSVRSVPTVRYSTGYVLKWYFGHGPGRLTINNDGSADAVIILTTSTTKPRTKMAVYVRANSTAVVRRIPNGDYHIYFALGRSWAPKLNRFLAVETRARFDDADLGGPALFSFSTTPSSSGGYYFSTWEIGLTPSALGTGIPTDVPELPSMN